MVGAVIRSKTFQSWATHKVAQYFSAELNTKVSIAGFRIDNFTFLHLDSIYVEDRQQDTVFFVQEFTVDLDRLSWTFDKVQKRINVNYAEVEGAKVCFRQYSDTADWNYEFVIDYFDPPRDSTDTIPGRPFILKVKQLDVINSSFSFKNPTYDSTWEAKFHPDDFRFNELNGTLEKFSIVDDSLAFTTGNLSAREKNGFYAKKMAADIRIHSRGLEFYNMLVETEKSSLGDELRMNYNNWDELGEFIPNVVFNARVKNSTVSMEDVAYWGPNMDNLKQVAKINGLVRGTIDNLKGRAIKLEAGKESLLAGEFNIKGLPDFYASYIDMKLDKSQTNAADIKQLFGIDSLPPSITALGKVDFTGKFTGFPKSFVAYGKFNTGLGGLTSDIKLDFTEGISTATYSGFLKSEKFDLGKLINESATIGKISFEANVEGNGLSLETIAVEVKGNVSAIEVQRYNYTNIEVDGSYTDKFFEGYARIRDENLDLDFNGGADFSNELPKMNFISTIRKANLQKLGLDSVQSLVMGKVYLDFSGDRIDNLDGVVSVANVSIMRNARLLKLDTASLLAEYSQNLRKLKLNSSIVDAEIAGQYNLSQLSGAVYHYASTLLPHIIKEDSNIQVNENFSFKTRFKNPGPLARFLWDDVSIEPFEASGSINTAANDVQLNINVQQVRIGEVNLRSVGIHTQPAVEGKKLLELKCGSYYQNDSLYVQNASALLTFDNSDVLFDIQAPQTITRLSASLKGKLMFSDTLYRLVFSQSKITSKIRPWDISNDAYLAYQPKEKRLMIEGFKLSSNNEWLMLNGAVGENPSDTLRIDFNRFGVGNVNYFTRPPKGQEVGGVLNGHIVLFNLFDVPMFTSNLSADSLSFGKDTLGDLRLSSSINNLFKIITVRGGFENGRLQGSKINGFVSFDKQARRNLNLTFSLNNATTRFFAPFLEGIASEFDGTFTTMLNLRGTFENPELSGEAALGRASFKIDYLGTKYFIDTAIVHISQNKFSISNTTLRDERGTPAYAWGYINHDAFSDFRIHLEVNDMRRFLALNTTTNDNDLYFGTAYMTGSYKLTGPFDDLYMEVKGKSEKGTTFNLKLADETTVGNYDFITFIDNNNPAPEPVPVNLEGIRLNLDLTVTPDADIKIIFDSQLGDVIQGTGNANLRMEINTLGDFRMYGTFVIEKGGYLFTALDFINRPFVLSKGGTITWTGDPLNANINLRAIYPKQTTVQPLVLGLVPDAELPNYKTPVEVNAVMDLRGQLMKPDIRFGIEIPDLTGLRGNNANTNVLLNSIRRIERDQEEMSRQVFSLLSVGTLATPTDNGYVASGATAANPGLDAAYNTVGNLLSSQITNWLSKYDPKWDIGIRVGQGGAQARTEFIVSASRRWLDDRLRFDFSADNTSQGNISVNYKIKPDGNIQARVFGRNSNNPIYNQNILSFGGGFFIRSEFENFGELKRNFQTTFRKKPTPTSAPPPTPPNPQPGGGDTVSVVPQPIYRR